MNGNRIPIPRSDAAAARKEWRKLGHERRREVVRLSKKGQVHSDPGVADVAYRWAISRVPLKKESRSARAAKGALLVLLDISTGGGPSLQELKARRVASRIIAATENSKRQNLD